MVSMVRFTFSWICQATSGIRTPYSMITYRSTAACSSPTSTLTPLVRLRRPSISAITPTTPPLMPATPFTSVAASPAMMLTTSLAIRVSPSSLFRRVVSGRSSQPSSAPRGSRSSLLPMATTSFARAQAVEDALFDEPGGEPTRLEVRIAHDEPEQLHVGGHTLDLQLVQRGAHAGHRSCPVGIAHDQLREHRIVEG